MNASDRSQFFKILGGVYDFYGRDLSTFAGTVWWQSCERFDLEQVTKAFSAHLMDAEHGRFLPKPADLVRVLQGTRTDRSLMAWAKVLDAIQHVGAYTSVCFDDGLIHAAIEDMGGWITLCRSTNDELPFLQKRFCDTFKAYTTRGDDVAYPAVLKGVAALENGTRGYRVEKPTLIGDATRAQQVMELGSDSPKTRITSPAALLASMSPRLAGEQQQAGAA